MKDSILAKFIREISDVRDKIERVYLFGSRARGNERPDSDYDLLVVVAENFSKVDKDVLYDIVMDILLATGRLISLKIFKEGEFKRLKQMQTPFMRHISKEGIQIG